MSGRGRERWADDDAAVLEAGEGLPRLVTAVPGPASAARVDTLARVECPGITARRARAGVARGLGEDPIVWARARGANVWDDDGNRFVDLTAAFGVALIGHAHAAVRAAVAAQSEVLLHAMGDVFPNGPRIALMEKLAARTPEGLGKSILTTGGAEAVEAALKTATLLQAARGRPDRTGVLAFSGGYHGLSYGALAVTAYKGDFRRPFASQLNPQVRHLPFGCDPEMIEAFVGGVASGGESIGTILVEPIQGRGGEVVPPAGWLAALRAICDRHGLGLVFDEIYCGLGRTGAWWAGEHEGVRPDVMAVGKALGGGMPVGACVGTDEAMDAWGASRGEAIHTSTFLGHPVAAAAGCAALDAMVEMDIPGRARAFEADARAFFEARGFGVRGRGAMLGLELGSPGRAARAMGELLKAGIITLPSGVEGDILALTPPLCLTDAQREAAFEAIAAACAG
jgi:4-aminobutyrate aminotransferase/(S)-3-amino-2-methylpropionate transaminase